MKRPFNKEDRIASSGSLEGLQELVIKFYFGSKIRIERDGEGGYAVYGSEGLLSSVGVFEEKTRAGIRFWAYFKTEVTP